MSRYALQWVVVLNSVVIAMFAIAHAIDINGSVFWGLLVVVVMAGQIWSATRPEPLPEPVPQGPEIRP